MKRRKRKKSQHFIARLGLRYIVPMLHKKPHIASGIGFLVGLIIATIIYLCR